MKALFAIREVASGKLLSEPTFEKKPIAKQHRRSLNEVSKEGLEILEYVVTYGPDHDKFDPNEKIRMVKVRNTEPKQEYRELEAVV